LWQGPVDSAWLPGRRPAGFRPGRTAGSARFGARDPRLNHRRYSLLRTRKPELDFRRPATMPRPPRTIGGSERSERAETVRGVGVGGASADEICDGVVLQVRSHMSDWSPTSVVLLVYRRKADLTDSNTAVRMVPLPASVGGVLLLWRSLPSTGGDTHERCIRKGCSPADPIARLS
jgi:hypothetical protein